MKRVLIVSWNAINGGLRQPICALITSNDRVRSVPTFVQVEPTSENGLKQTSWVLCHALITLPETRLDAHPIGDLGPLEMSEVEAALARALDLPGANESEPSSDLMPA